MEADTGLARCVLTKMQRNEKVQYKIEYTQHTLKLPKSEPWKKRQKHESKLDCTLITAWPHSVQ